jgi:hypothetical protein
VAENMRNRNLRNAAIAVALVVLAIVADRTIRSGWMERVLSGGREPLAGGLAGPGPVAGTVAPEPNLKIAFIGDSGSGPSFQAVLELIRREGGQAIVHMGDAIYDDEPAPFWTVVHHVLGHEFPYFLTQGNHDLKRWPELAQHAFEHLKAAGAVTDAAGQIDPRLGLTWKGVSMLLLGATPRNDDPRYIIDRFSRDNHIWKICAWHKNQNQLQVGGKEDEMGWEVYESCRRMGALIQNGHEHSYERTKTLTSTVEQKVDPDCRDPGHLCVRPGAVPVFVSGLGGRSIRDQERCLPSSYPYGCKGEWAFIYTSNQGARFGAEFITFNVDGDPRKARGYFKNIDGEVVDRFELRAQ